MCIRDRSYCPKSGDFLGYQLTQIDPISGAQKAISPKPFQPPCFETPGKCVAAYGIGDSDSGKFYVHMKPTHGNANHHELYIGDLATGEMIKYFNLSLDSLSSVYQLVPTAENTLVGFEGNIFQTALISLDLATGKITKFAPKFSPKSVQQNGPTIDRKNGIYYVSLTSLVDGHFLILAIDVKTGETLHTLSFENKLFGVVGLAFA
eukprot:TRINITY_DN3524_c0_g1_i1.p1 TRINITY_DN3524_c0_g1~~TRINITY_DN3524_c0_g1_i1.p1  ORF type:complete len:206 (-),score=24.95 TRINITY_DN3524_c0_g1_i1:102-719(-)